MVCPILLEAQPILSGAGFIIWEKLVKVGDLVRETEQDPEWCTGQIGIVLEDVTSEMGVLKTEGQFFKVCYKRNICIEFVEDIEVICAA